MLSRHIGPRGRTILVCELVTLGTVVALGFALEAVSPGWWGITRDALSRLTEPGDPVEGHGPSVLIRILKTPEVILASAEPSTAPDPEAFAANAIYLLTSRPCLKIALSTPRVARLDLFSGYPEKDKVGALKASLRVKRIGEFVELTCVRGTREEKALLLNAVAEAFKETFVERASLVRQEGIEKLTAYFDELERRLALLRKQAAQPDRKGDAPEPAQIASITRILNRLGDEIQVRQLNQNAPDRVEILHMAH